jgi:DNA-binding transcriptional LysR family regulator
MLDLRRLRVLHAVAAHGSITAAAKALSFTPPAVSQQLGALERELGISLTQRSGRGIVLTPAADVLVGHTETLLAQLARAEADLAGFRGTITGRVSLAAFPSAAATIVPIAWADLAKTAPHVELDLVTLEPDDSLPLVLRDQLDVAVVHEYNNLPRPLDATFDSRPLLKDPVLIAVPRNHPAQDGIPLNDLVRENFVAPDPTTSCAEMTRRACAEAGFTPRIVARSSDFQVLLNLVAASVGVALVPQLAATHLPSNVRLLRPRQNLTRSIYAISRRSGKRAPAVRLVLEALTAASAIG